MDEDLNRSSPLENLVIGMLVALVAVVWFILLGSQIYLYEAENHRRTLTKEGAVAMGHLDNEHTDLVLKIRTDLKIPEETEIKNFYWTLFPHIWICYSYIFYRSS